MKTYLVSIFDAARGKWSQYVLTEKDIGETRRLFGDNYFDKNYRVVDFGKYVKGRFRSVVNGLSVRRFETVSGDAYEIFRDRSARAVCPVHKPRS